MFKITNIYLRDGTECSNICKSAKYFNFKNLIRIFTFHNEANFSL